MKNEDLNTWLRRLPHIAYVEVETGTGGFCLTGPVFDVYVEGERFGRIMRSWRNRSRWEAAPVFWFECEAADGAQYARQFFPTLEETIIHVQEVAMHHHGGAQSC